MNIRIETAFSHHWDYYHHRLSDRWYASIPVFENELSNIRAGTNQIIVQSRFKELITYRYQNYNQIFTYGSKDDTRVGAGTCAGIHTSDRNSSLRLPDECRVFFAEAFALIRAVPNTHKHRNVIILTDSASCLDALR